jgi:hypothetical protein
MNSLFTSLFARMSPPKLFSSRASLRATAEPSSSRLLPSARHLSATARKISIPVPEAKFDPNWGVKKAWKDLRNVMWIPSTKFPLGFRTMFVQRRRIKPNLMRRVLRERKRYMLENQDKWTLMDVLVKERERGL